MHKKSKLPVLLFILLYPLLLCAQMTELKSKVYHFELKQNLLGSPEIIFDAITGDISPWWDHTYSEKPVKLFIEPRPGGHFLEVFNEQGDGVIHATVTGAQRGKFFTHGRAVGTGRQSHAHGYHL